MGWLLQSSQQSIVLHWPQILACEIGEKGKKKKSFWMVRWIVRRVLQHLPILVGEEVRSRRVFSC